MGSQGQLGQGTRSGSLQQGPESEGEARSPLAAVPYPGIDGEGV